MRRFLPLIENDSITYRHDLAVHVKPVLPSTRDPSLENPDYSFRLALLHSVTYLSFHYQLPSCSLWTVFGAVSSIVLFVSCLFRNIIILLDLLVHHKDWLTYSDGTDRPSKLWHNFHIPIFYISIISRQFLSHTNHPWTAMFRYQ